MSNVTVCVIEKFGGGDAGMGATVFKKSDDAYAFGATHILKTLQDWLLEYNNAENQSDLSINMEEICAMYYTRNFREVVAEFGNGKEYLNNIVDLWVTVFEDCDIK